ncbi:MAG TPA: ATP-binding protein [Vicinamibacterales bacterium]|nr:ATP-binding protein [Vicinamibacterales bacterium]
MGSRFRPQRSVPAAATPLQFRGGGSSVSFHHANDASADAGREQLTRVNAALEAQARSIGQALHDESSQMLVAANNSLAEAIAIAPPPVGEHLVLVRSYLDTIEQQLRSFAHELRPRILDELGLVAAIEFLAASRSLNRPFGVAVRCDVERSLPDSIETAVYRFVQEALTNVNRHSRATRVLIEVLELPGALRCRIADNGVGFDSRAASRSGLGLFGIRERFVALGAGLAIHSAQGGGTELVATIPLEKHIGGSHSTGRRSQGGAGQPARHPRAGEARDRR